jgi:hypothetical protein
MYVFSTIDVPLCYFSTHIHAVRRRSSYSRTGVRIEAHRHVLSTFPSRSLSCMSKTKAKTKAPNGHLAEAAANKPHVSASGAGHKTKATKDIMHVPEVSVIEPTSESNASAVSAWAWAALADPASSRLAPVLTPDGRCVSCCLCCGNAHT